MPDLFEVQIVDDASGEVVKRFKPTTKRQAELIADGVEINLDHNKYTVIVEPAREEAPNA